MVEADGSASELVLIRPVDKPVDNCVDDLTPYRDFGRTDIGTSGARLSGLRAQAAFQVCQKNLRDQQLGLALDPLNSSNESNDSSSVSDSAARTRAMSRP